MGWFVGKTVHIVKTPISDRSHVRFFFKYFIFRLFSAKKLKISLENAWLLLFPPNYSDYTFGQLLVFGVCDFIRFYFFQQMTEIWAKVDLEGRLASVLT